MRRQFSRGENSANGVDNVYKKTERNAKIRAISIFFNDLRMMARILLVTKYLHWLTRSLGHFMITKSLGLQSLVIASLVLASSISQAALTVYTDQASFLAAVSAPGTDTFDDVDGTTASPISRTAGAYSYSASATDGFFGVGTTSDHWLSTYTSKDTILFNNFGGGVQAIGGYFFGSTIDGVFFPGQSITVVAGDSDGDSITKLISDSTTTGFLGFISDSLITQLSVTAVQIVESANNWAAVNDLVLATTSSNNIPEPGTVPMVLAALGVLGLMAKRRKA